MNCPSPDRASELKYQELARQVITRLQGPPEGAWPRFAAAVRGGDASALEGLDPVVAQACLDAIASCPESELRLLWLGTDSLWKQADEENADDRARWEDGVVKELYQRVRYAAGGPEDAEPEQPPPAEDERRLCLDEDDLAFLSKVARQLALRAARPGLDPEQAGVIRRAVEALRRLPDPTRGLDVAVEIAHRMGDEEFSETYRYGIALGTGRVALTSIGTQDRRGAGATSFELESLEWRADGQSTHRGSRDSWLERLIYALGRDHTLTVADREIAGD